MSSFSVGRLPLSFPELSSSVPGDHPDWFVRQRGLRSPNVFGLPYRAFGTPQRAQFFDKQTSYHPKRHRCPSPAQPFIVELIIDNPEEFKRIFLEAYLNKRRDIASAEKGGAACLSRRRDAPPRRVAFSSLCGCALTFIDGFVNVLLFGDSVCLHFAAVISVLQAGGRPALSFLSNFSPYVLLLLYFGFTVWVVCRGCLYLCFVVPGGAASPRCLSKTPRSQ